MNTQERDLLLAVAAIVVQLADNAGTITSADGQTIDAQRLLRLADAVRAVK